MTKRERIYSKYDGKCAYTGKPLGDDWQIDHIQSKKRHEWDIYCNCTSIEEVNAMRKEVDREENLFPALKIVNHYKRSRNLETFREFMLKFHIRLGKLPKRTSKEATRKRIEYMHKVAEAFGITTDKPFTGTFFFERQNNDSDV